LAEEGNILQNVEKLSASLLLTIFPQLPIIFYFGLFQDSRYSIENVLFVAMAAITILEIGFILHLLKTYIQLNKVALVRAQQKVEGNKSSFIS
jgi:hypothetical protein